LRPSQTRSGVIKCLLQLLIILSVLTSAHAVAAPIDPSKVAERVCNVKADYFLGVENYPEAIRLHQQVIAQDPRNALAHYHLGFAYGMTGRYRDEIAEYQRAVELGLTDWTLFLNLGLAYFQRADYRRAADALKVAERLAPERAEPHYNLALTYERLGLLSQAEQEGLTALTLDPRDPDIRNTLAIVHAELGNYGRARQEWSALLAANPQYLPAKTNLAILDRAVMTDARRANVPSVSEAHADAEVTPSAYATPLHRAGSALFFDSEGVSQLKLGPVSAKGGDH
jgi:tetratricopeptide (TPR) repeat protein